MHRRHNGLRTAVLLGGLSALIIVIGSLFGRMGLVVALVIAIGTNAYAYWNSDKLALRAMRARPVSEQVSPAAGPATSRATGACRSQARAREQEREYRASSAERTRRPRPQSNGAQARPAGLGKRHPTPHQL